MSRGVMVSIRGFDPLGDSSNLSGTAKLTNVVAVVELVDTSHCECEASNGVRDRNSSVTPTF